MLAINFQMPKEASRPKVEHSGEPGVEFVTGMVQLSLWLQWLILDNLRDALASQLTPSSSQLWDAES